MFVNYIVVISNNLFSLRYNLIDIITNLLLIVTSGTVSKFKSFLSIFPNNIQLRLIRQLFEYRHSLGPEFQLF